MDKYKKYLKELRYAIRVLDAHDKGDVSLVTGVYDAMINAFGRNSKSMEKLSDQAIDDQWDKCCASIKENLVLNGLISASTFDEIWDAYSIVVLEQAHIFA